MVVSVGVRVTAGVKGDRQIYMANTLPTFILIFMGVITRIPLREPLISFII